MERSRKSLPAKAQKSLPVRKLSVRLAVMRRYRAVPAVVFAIVVSALVGGFFGRSALAIDDKTPDYKTFTVALDAIEANYVGTVESDSLVYSAIRGMLGTLDPHSSFFDPKAYAQMRERQEGRYYGLGIQIQSTPDGDIIATGVFEGSPAYKKGVRRGDAFARIGDENAKGWTHRAGDAEAARPEGDDGAHRAEAPRLRAADSARRDARRGVHPDRARRVHDRFDDRLHQAAGFRREHRPRPQARAARSQIKGHAPARARHPRQSRRSARSGHQGVERVPAARAR